MGNPTKLRPYSLAPHPSDEAGVKTFFDWVQTTLNALVGQQVPPDQGFNSLANPQINPASNQLRSAGSRANSTASAITWSATTTTITFYWDGTHSSKPLTIYRDDNTVAGPFVGSLLVSGLTPGTTYFFYPFFQDFSELPGANVQNVTAEPLGTVVFASVPAAKPVGTPAVAYTAQNQLALQRQYLLDHIPLALNLATTGVATPGAGTTTGSGGTGGGGAGSGIGRFAP